jgi:CRP-like cAMP-binding protein
MEMIVSQSSLLTLTMDGDGSVMVFPIQEFQALLKVDHEMLWTVSYEILTEVQRIFQFVNAAQFPRDVTPEQLNDQNSNNNKNNNKNNSNDNNNNNNNNNNDTSSTLTPKKSVELGMTLQQIIERVFSVSDLQPHELSEFRLLVLGVGAPLYQKGSKATAFWVLIDGELDLPSHLYARIDGAVIVGELGLLTRQDRSRDVSTITQCTVMRISVQGLHYLVSRNLEVMWMLARPALTRVIAHLASVSVGFEHRVLRSGCDLYHAGEASLNLYILINGRLRIVDAHGNGAVDVSKASKMSFVCF